MITKQDIAAAFKNWDDVQAEAVAWKAYPSEQPRLQDMIDAAAARIASVRDAAIAELCATRGWRVSKREFGFTNLILGTFEREEEQMPPIPGAIECYVDGFRPAAIILFNSWPWSKHVALAEVCELTVERLQPSWRHPRNTAAIYTRRVAT
jgi:hypothetical protein